MKNFKSYFFNLVFVGLVASAVYFYKPANSGFVDTRQPASKENATKVYLHNTYSQGGSMIYRIEDKIDEKNENVCYVIQALDFGGINCVPKVQ